jgi:hypothetical protein
MTIAIADIADSLVTNDYDFVNAEYPYYSRTNRDGSINEVTLEEAENSLTLIRYNAPNGRQIAYETVELTCNAKAQQALRLIA